MRDFSSSSETTSTSSFSESCHEREADNHSKEKIDMFFNGLSFSKARINNVGFGSCIFVAFLFGIMNNLPLCWESPSSMDFKYLTWNNPGCWTYSLSIILAFCLFMTIALVSHALLLLVYTENRFWPYKVRDVYCFLHIFGIVGIISLFVGFIARFVAAFDTRRHTHWGWIYGVFAILGLISIFCSWYMFVIFGEGVSDKKKQTIAEVMEDYTKTLPTKK